jgi:Family of unknown function (DUF6624)
MLQKEIMDIALSQELILMAETDRRVLEELFEAGELPSEKYHPTMREVHERNAAFLKKIIQQHGWPGSDLVGHEGSKAAWLIAQHAVFDLSIMREFLRFLKQAVASGTAEGWQAAFLEDRVLTMSGKKQIYGTQFDRDEDGWPVPCPIENAENVNERRAKLGLNCLEERLKEMTEAERLRREKRPKR